MDSRPDPTLPDQPPRDPGHGPTPPVDEEAEWIRAAQAGDRSAFARLIERYWDRLYRWLYHLTRDRHAAEDLTQETFLKALAAMKSFRPGSNFRAWVFRIGHNNFVNQKRSERRTKHQLPEDAAGPEHVGRSRRRRSTARRWRRSAGRWPICRPTSGRRCCCG